MRVGEIFSFGGYGGGGCDHGYGHGGNYDHGGYGHRSYYKDHYYNSGYRHYRRHDGIRLLGISIGGN